MRSRPPIRGRSGLKSRDLALAFLLACISWLALTLVWTHASPGGLSDRIVGILLSPSYRVGKHLAHLCFPNQSGRNIIGYYLAPLFGVATEVAFFMALWLVGIGIRRWMNTRRSLQNPIAP